MTATRPHATAKQTSAPMIIRSHIGGGSGACVAPTQMISHAQQQQRQRDSKRQHEPRWRRGRGVTTSGAREEFGACPTLSTGLGIPNRNKTNKSSPTCVQ